MHILFDTQVDVHNNLGDLWRAQGQVGRQAAQQCYSEALRIDNTYAPAWRGLGDMFRENNEHSQAVTCYQVVPTHIVKTPSVPIHIFTIMCVVCVSKDTRLVTEGMTDTSDQSERLHV